MKQVNEVQRMDDYSRQLLTGDGFVDRFFKMKNYYTNNYEAYEAVERQHMTLTGRRRYKNYESFKTVFLRKVRRKKL